MIIMGKICWITKIIDETEHSVTHLQVGSGNGQPGQKCENLS
jgi:hypothetical protein